MKRSNSRRSPTRPNASESVHYACFECRKAYKQRGSSNWNPDLPERPFPCPECKRPMVRMGKYFHVPPQRAVRQWEKVELLHHYGETFDDSGKNLDVKCRTLSSTIEYLTTPHRSSADVRAMLKRLRQAHAALRKGPSVPQPDRRRRPDDTPTPEPLTEVPPTADECDPDVPA